MEMKLGLDMANLTPLKKRLLVVLPAIVIVAFFLTLFIFPAMEERAKLNEEVQKQSDEINLLKRHSERLPTLIAENEKLQRRLSELQMQLPEEKEVSGLLKQVSNLGVKSGLHVMTWKPKAKTVHESKEIYEIPVEVEMRGGFHHFGQFFSSLAKLDRIVNLNDINIKDISVKPAAQKSQTGPRGLQVNFITTTYSLIPEHEKKQIEEQEKAKEKK